MEGKVIDYYIVVSKTGEELISGVRDLIKEGWEPTGGLTMVTIDDDTTFYTQTVLQRELCAESERNDAGFNTVTVSTGDALIAALKDAKDSGTPTTIYIDGTISQNNSSVDCIDIRDMSNVSILGVGTRGELDGVGFRITQSSDITIQNITNHDVPSASDFSVQGGKL